MISINKKLKSSQIIIVDDNEYYAQLIKANIFRRGYKNVKIFNDGESAIEYINKNKPRCVILDHILSTKGLNGNDVLKKIKEISDKINVIIISGQDDMIVATDYMKSGAYDYIIKNDRTFFYLQNSLIKLNRILITKSNKFIIYSTISILLVLTITLLYLMFLK
jgi:DNA-binding NtrC family response regulator